MKKTLFIFLAGMLFFGCAVREKKIETIPDQQDIEPLSIQQKVKTVFYPELPQQPRLQFLVSITTKMDIKKLNTATNKSSPNENQSFVKIERPYDIGAVKGKIYISDRTYKKVLIIDLEKNELSHIWDKYDSVGIWVTEDDYKYVADFNRKQIIVFDNNNTLIRTYGEKGQFNKPLDVAVYQNKIYICDFNKHRIIVIDKDSGSTIQEIGNIGTEEGNFYKPTHVIVDSVGNLYVNDFFNMRIQKFDKNGNFLKTFGYPGDTLGAFARPKGLDADKEGHLYVVDTAFENVQIFDNKTANLLFFFGGFGSEPGSMYLPSGIYIDYQNVEYFKKYVDRNFSLKYLVYVGNMWGAEKLNVYGFGEWRGKHKDIGIK